MIGQIIRMYDRLRKEPISRQRRAERLLLSWWIEKNSHK